MLPARSGSKGLPDKNIKLLCGKPLLAYATEAIQRSKTFQNHSCYIMVNTDSQKYAEIAMKHGAKVPFLRSDELSSDNANIMDAIHHTVIYFEEQKLSFDLFALVQVTSPFLQSTDLDSAILEMEKDESLDSIISVTESEVMPLWCNTLDISLNMNNFLSEEARKNRQELPKYYRITGSFKIARWNHVIHPSFDWCSRKSKAFIVSQDNSIDIDTALEFDFAEFIMTKKIGQM